MNDLLSRYLPLGHIPERRLASFAEAHAATGAVGDDLADLPTPAEMAHLDGCVRCRSLLVGHERTLTLLTGAWSVQQVPMPATSGATRVGLGRTLTPASARSRGQRQGASIFVIAVVVLLVGLVGFGAATLNGQVQLGGSPGPATAPLIAAHPGLDLSKVPGRLSYSLGPQTGPSRIVVTTATGAEIDSVGPKGYVSQATWAPDGKHVAYLVRHVNRYDEQQHLWVAKADGSDAKRISPGNASWPAWSPKGDLIAFTSIAAESNIYLIKPDGTGLRQLSSLTSAPPDVPPASGNPGDTPRPGDPAETGSAWGQLAWSPDGREVAAIVNLYADGQADFGLWIWGADAKDPSHPVRRIKMPRFSHASDPAWSPDGRQIVFSATGANALYGDLWTVPAAGGRIERLADIPGGESQPAWSADGSYLAFQWGTDNQTRGPDVPEVTSGIGGGDWLSDLGILRLADGAYASVTDARETLLFPDTPRWVPGQ